MTEIRIRAEGPQVHVVVDGKLVIQAPWNVALDLARELTKQARAAEEIANAEGIIFDQAILARTGAPFGLSSNKAIQEEAMQSAAWDSRLRRYLPGGIKSQEAVGTPVVRHAGKRS